MKSGRGGECYESPDASGLSLLLPSPARRTPLFHTTVLAGEGFILRVHPEGLGVRLELATRGQKG